MKILFMGTPDFAKQSLEAIYEAGFEIVGVVTNIDKPKGRGMKLVCSPVKEYAISKNLKIYQPEKVRNNTEFIEEIKALNPDVICVVAYGKILPKEILEIPPKGCINVHASLLPKYRGAAPIQWAVLNGDKVTGVTTMYMDVGMDTGDMILKKEVLIGDEETTGELWERLSNIGASLLIETLNLVEEGKAPRTKQPEEFSLAPMLDKSIAKIDWENNSAMQIKNLVRGLNPFMGAYTTLNQKKIKFWKVKVYEYNETKDLNIEYNDWQNAKSGTIIKSDSKKGIFIKAKDGIIQVLEIQGENSKKMPITEYLKGNKVISGDIFS